MLEYLEELQYEAQVVSSAEKTPAPKSSTILYEELFQDIHEHASELGEYTDDDTERKVALPCIHVDGRPTQLTLSALADGSSKIHLKQEALEGSRRRNAMDAAVQKMTADEFIEVFESGDIMAFASELLGSSTYLISTPEKGVTIVGYDGALFPALTDSDEYFSQVFTTVSAEITKYLHRLSASDQPTQPSAFDLLEAPKAPVPESVLDQIKKAISKLFVSS